MKILIAPLITEPNADTRYFLTRSLLELFRNEDIDTAVCADPENHFRRVQVFPSSRPKKPFFSSRNEGRSIEDLLYKEGVLSCESLCEDDADLEAAITQFRPNLILSLDRPAALIAAKRRGIPCWAFVYPAMYRYRNPSTSSMKGLNEALHRLRMEQELRLSTLYAKASRRIAFSPARIAPFPQDAAVTRLGSFVLPTVPKEHTNRVCIYMGQTRISGRKFTKIVEEAFVGAPYYVYVWHPSIKPHESSNIQYLENPDPSLIEGSIAMIHDGSDYFSNLSIRYGIPQLILSDHSCIRLYNALSAGRNRFGIYLFEEDLTMASLYENYRLLVNDDTYYEKTQELRKETLDLKDLSGLMELIRQDFL